jgi:adenylate kinase family enzyme
MTIDHAIKIKTNPIYFFIIGKPGSGKSTAVKILLDQFKLTSETILLDDYDILREWFEKDKNHEKFEPFEHKGFKVKDYKLMDDVLAKLREDIESFSPSNGKFIIEFSRNDYTHAFSFFPEDIINNSSIIYIDCSFEKCLERNELRAKNGLRYVPIDVMKNYYIKDDYKEFNDNSYYKDKITCIKNDSTIENFKKNLNSIILD